jgi:hypothetical protein
MVSVAASTLATAKRILLVSFEPATDPSMARNALSTAPPVVDSLTIPTATDRAIFALISSVAVADVTVDANFRSTGSEIVLGVTVSDTNSAEYGLETGKDMPGVLLDPDKNDASCRVIGRSIVSGVRLDADNSPAHALAIGTDTFGVVLPPARFAANPRATAQSIASVLLTAPDVADKEIEESGSFKPPSCLARNDLNMVDPPNYRGPLR